MHEVKRYDAVHLRYEDSNIRYGEGCEVEVVTASDYAALEAENARLRADLEQSRDLIVEMSKHCNATALVADWLERNT